MPRLGLVLVVLAVLLLVTGGCTHRHAAMTPAAGDLRHAGTLDDDVAIGPWIGAADACGGVLWERGPTSVAFLLRPGLPDTLAVYGDDEPIADPIVVAAVPTP